MQLFTPILRKTVVPIALVITALGLSGCAQRETIDDRHVLKFTTANFQSEVLASPQPVLVDFWATWCGPCKMVAPSVAALATQFEGKAKVGKVDVDGEPDLAKQYDISSIPALLIFKDGKVVDQIIGVQSKAKLEARLKKIVDDSPSTNAPQNKP